MMLRNWLAIGIGALALSACGEEDKPSESTNTCEEGVDFESVGEPFLKEHCQTCHSAETAEVAGEDHVFETEAQVREHGAEMYENVDTGMMPPTPTKPPEAETAAFLEWLHCSGAAGENHEHDH